jgi:excinuclease ABC subunit C
MSQDAEENRPGLKGKWQEAPHQPGVYLMRDRLGKVIYVGKARDLRKRLAYYFQPSRKTLGDLKTRALIRSIRDFDLHVTRNETEALLLEGRLIKDFRPRYNISFRDDKRFLLVRVRLDDPWPRLQLTRIKREDGARYFGPFAHSGALRETVEWLNRRFGLRVCSPPQPDDDDYKHCHADVIKNCCAPCVGRIAAEEYRARAAAAAAVFDGGAKPLVEEMRGEMEAAAAALDFERAARLRDAITALTTTVEPSRRFTKGGGVTLGPAIDPLADLADLQQALGLAAPPLVMECFDISNISSTYSVASMVRFTNGRPDNAQYRRYRIKNVAGQNDFASMAEVVRRRYGQILRDLSGGEGEGGDSQEAAGEAARRAARAAERRGHPAVHLPDLVVVDGGKGQLGMATRELQALGLWDLPVIGLAKEREEIHRPGSEFPLVLPHARGAVKLLQRIRDEAHRFANSYHQLLLRRRVRESRLDDFPGMTPGKKLALLAAFGSLERLKSRTTGEIAALPGISPAFARRLAEWLAAGGTSGA